MSLLQMLRRQRDETRQHTRMTCTRGRAARQEGRQATYAPLKAAATLSRRLGREELGADGGSAEAETEDDGGFIFQASSAYALRLVAVSTSGFP